MRPRSPATDMILVIAAAWAAVVVVQWGMATGEWLTVIRQAVGLMALAGLLGRLAAAVDNAVDDLRSGTSGRGGGRPAPMRVRVRRPDRPRRGGDGKR
ncbi:MAG TPA: hypothetical protein VMM13_12700 [Euzebya sp.]|nr:hypothetical protein [Euzebya sp.]